MQRLAWSMSLVVLCAAGGARAQAPRRLPIIAGNDRVQVLVELDGTVKTWGQPIDYLSLGVGDNKSPAITVPTALPGVRGIVAASVGAQQVLLLTAEGNVVGWGSNSDCEVGTGDYKRSYTPVPIAKLRGVKQVVAGEKVSGAVLADGTVWMWGLAQKGHMGDGTWGYATKCAPVPKQVEGLTGVTQLAIGAVSVLALKSDGTVWGWGTNAAGELCDGTREHVLHPAQLKGIAGATSVAVSMNTIIVLGDGTVRMCGNNDMGALGDPNAPDDVAETDPKAFHLTPFKVPGIAGVRSASTHGKATIVQLKDGTLRGWGMAYQGRLGDGRSEEFGPKPATPIRLGPVLAHYHCGLKSYAIRADGTVMAWGGRVTSAPKDIVAPTPVFTVTLDEPRP
jgi:alpha-tubulin suppressor-like RCC1 family protein